MKKLPYMIYADLRTAKNDEEKKLFIKTYNEAYYPSKINGTSTYYGSNIDGKSICKNKENLHYLPSGSTIISVMEAIAIMNGNKLFKIF